MSYGDSDYAPVGIYDDEEEQLRRAGYAPAVPSVAPDATAPPPVESSYAPAAPSRAPEPAVGSLDDLESRAAHPSYPAVATDQPLRPQWKGDDAYHAAGGHDYAPAEPHGWAKFGHTMAAFNPVTNRIFNQMPEERAEQKYKAATAEYEAPFAEREKEAQTEQKETQAELERTQAENARHPQPVWENVPGVLGPQGQPVEREKNSGQYRYGDLPGGVHPLKAPGETQEQNKLAYQAIVGKLDAAGLATDPRNVDKSLDAALKNGQITKEEHASAKSYEAANQTPGTNLTVHIAGQDEAAKNAINKTFEGSEVIAHMPDGRRVQMSYADAKAQNLPPERLVKLDAKEAQENRDKAASTSATFQSLDSYRSDLKKMGGQLTPDDRKAMEVLTSHAKSDPGFLGKIVGGVFDAAAGEPLTGYSEKVFQGLMTKDQYNTLSPAGRKLVADYFSTVISNFANMKSVLGSLGRNEIQLQAEINTIPLPYLDWQSAADQFDNKRDDMSRRAISMPEIYAPPKH